MARLMELVINTSAKYGIKCETLSPLLSSHREEGECVAVPVNANFKGSFSNMIKMLRAMETGKNRVNVVTVLMNNNNTTYPVANATVVIEIYQPKKASSAQPKLSNRAQQL